MKDERKRHDSLKGTEKEQRNTIQCGTMVVENKGSLAINNMRVAFG